MPTTITCIYCRRSNAEAIFDREHVIPESLGKFEPDNLVLNCVCKDCNGTFGRTIDAVLGRDSSEAFLRFTHGLKSLNRSHELKNTRSVLRAPAAPDETHGSFLNLSHDDQGVLTKSPFQIRVRNRERQQYEYFREKDFQLLKDKQHELDLNDLELHGSPRASDSDWDRMREALIALFSELGRRNVQFGEIRETGSSINVPTISTKIDVSLERALVKIAFNYLSYVSEMQGAAELIWHRALEPIRQFVRYGTELNHPIFYVEEQRVSCPLEAGERRGNLHLLAIDWIFHRNGAKTLRARVSLFDSQTYVFWLISNYPERPLPTISTAHVFNLQGPPRKCRQFNLPEFAESD